MLAPTAGAFAKRPNPWPERCGYHGVWHVLTIVAAGLHFIAIQDVLT
jgi:predicted membrane channel-forming protein YqfA (hemolysin III family)